MDVGTRPHAIREWLRRERRDEPVLRLGDAPHGVPELELLVCGAQRIAIPDGDLLLAGAVLVDRLFDLDDPAR